MTPHKLTPALIAKFKVDLFAGVGVLHGGVPRPEAGISPLPPGSVPKPTDAMVAHADMVRRNLDLSMDALALAIPPDGGPTPDATKYYQLCVNERRYNVELQQAMFWMRIYMAIAGCGAGFGEVGDYCWNMIQVYQYYQDELTLSNSRIKELCGVTDGGGVN